MLTIREIKKAATLEEAWQLNQKRPNRIMGGMLWMRLSKGNVATMIDLSALGLEETGLAKIIRAGYNLLGLQTYFTAGPKEVRAWTFVKGMKAPQCAGIIHTDFERGFIRAETISYDDYVQFGGEQGCKDAGKMRSEGKEYVVQDGDLMNFLFNV